MLVGDCEFSGLVGLLAGDRELSDVLAGLLIRYVPGR